MIRQFKAGSCYSYILSSDGAGLIVDPHISLFDAYADYIDRQNLLKLPYDRRLYKPKSGGGACAMG
jgi:hypothetical protein